MQHSGVRDAARITRLISEIPSCQIAVCNLLSVQPTARRPQPKFRGYQVINCLNLPVNLHKKAAHHQFSDGDRPGRLQTHWELRATVGTFLRHSGSQLRKIWCVTQCPQAAAAAAAAGSKLQPQLLQAMLHCCTRPGKAESQTD